MARWQFSVTENGVEVASGDAPDRNTALREAGHYVMQYAQDGGDVKAEVWDQKTKLRTKRTLKC